MKARILLLTDSLGLPRSTPEYCGYDKTWPVLLREDGYRVHQVSIGGATLSDLVKQIQYHQMFGPDIVIVQAGIVDCAPRFMTKNEMNFVSCNSLLEKVAFKLMARDSVRNYRRVTYTAPAVFKKNLRQIEEKFQDVPVYFIQILPASQGYEEKLPGITKNVNAYNKIINSFKHIRTDDFDLGCIMSDFHHLTEEGNKRVFMKIRETISGLNG